MKRLRFTVLVIAVSILMAAAAQAEDIKIGYIDLSKTFDEYEKTQQYETSLGKKGDTKEAERQTLVDQIKELKDEMVLLSDKGKDDKQAAIDDKIKELQEFDRETRDTLRKERDEMVRDILREIDKIVQDYGKEHGYTLILHDKVLVYGNETIDITEDIIELLNTKKQ